MANSGSIVRAKCDKDFTTFFNSVLRDDRISLRARGLLAYLVSLPADWVIQKTSLDSIVFPNVERLNDNGKRVQGEKREGRDAVFSAFNELVEFGYIQAVMKVTPLGRRDGYDYIVYNTPQSNIIKNKPPFTDYPITDNPITDNPSFTKEILVLNTAKQKKESTKIADEKKSSAFLDCMNVYFEFFMQKTTLPPKIDGSEGKALKAIVKHLKSISKDKTDEGVINAFKFLFVQFDKWDEFHKKQLNLKQINSNLNNIINSIKNGNNKIASKSDIIAGLKEGGII